MPSLSLSLLLFFLWRFFLFLPSCFPGFLLYCILVFLHSCLSAFLPFCILAYLHSSVSALLLSWCLAFLHFCCKGCRFLYFLHSEAIPTQEDKQRMHLVPAHELLFFIFLQRLSFSAFSATWSIPKQTHAAWQPTSTVIMQRSIGSLTPARPYNYIIISIIRIVVFIVFLS